MDHEKNHPITLNSTAFVYTVDEKPGRLTNEEKQESTTIFTAYRKDITWSPFKITFIQDNDANGDNRLTNGISISRNNEKFEFNLQTGETAQFLIELAIENGWNWEEDHMEVKDGILFLKNLGFIFG